MRKHKVTINYFRQTYVAKVVVYGPDNWELLSLTIGGHSYHRGMDVPFVYFSPEGMKRICHQIRYQLMERGKLVSSSKEATA